MAGRASPLVLALALGAAACGHPGGGADGGLRPSRPSAEGPDQVIGVLHVTATEAYIERGAHRLRLIEEPPQTAMTVEELLARTAESLRRFDGTRVRATGSLQGTILWSARVELAE